MSFMQKVLEQNYPIWDKCLATNFVQELQNGTLANEKFKQYMVQDTIYLKHYARLYGKAIYHAKTFEEIKLYYSVLSFVNDTESATRIEYLASVGLSDAAIEFIEPLAENRNYYEFMLDVAKTGDTKKILMAVLPCMLSYSYIFGKIDKIPNTKYIDFIMDYASVNYEDNCKMWVEFTDKLCENINENESKELNEIFTKSSMLELGFWNMSYR